MTRKRERERQKLRIYIDSKTENVCEVEGLAFK